MQELESHLAPKDRPRAIAPQQYAVCGMGGVGKTELVVEWFYRHTDRFKAAFWVDAAEPSQLASNYSRIASTLMIQPPGQTDDLVANREIAKAWFANATVPWLVVFDNADSIVFLADYWPCGPTGSVLVTSRDPLAKTIRSFTMPGLDLEPFPEDEASEFVRRVTNCDPTETERQASIEMARELGCLPLAIIHMAGVIRRRHWSLQEFMENYQARYQSFRKAPNNSQLRRYGSNLATAWKFDDLDVDSLRLLRLLSMLSPDRIGEGLLHRRPRDDGLGYAGLFSDEDQFEDAKGVLLSSSVIKRHKIRRELSIHRVIAQEVRACMSADALYDSFCIAVAIICEAWPFNHALEKRHSTSRWSKCEEIFPHLEHIHKLYGIYRADWTDSKCSIELVRLFQEGGAYLHERGFSFRGKPYLELALELYGKAAQKSTDHTEVLSDIYYTLGAVANEINDGPGCLHNNIILLEMRRGISAERGKPDVRLAAAHSQIGIAYMMTGKLALATEYFKQSIEIFKSLDEFHVDMLGFPAANLGLSYWMQGQLDEAEEIFANALGDREKEYGKMDKVSYKTGRILHGYGNVKASKAEAARLAGDAERYKLLMGESQTLHEAALAQFESTLGGYHHRVADMCHKIAGHRIMDGDDQAAQ
ncbi:uncharacterized protein DNG_06120 [Cephalotrichum gorgonifer]|uniref:DUF7779 domain-containing protein n=1 Tax=Cephalotrichum gorgonifer TaxID=2041049 RepID=A0AAE8SWX6_9PEZI|nr:uncharacterized protein DNG_06120 [Cephalotrichum gorgonifer]